MGSSRLVAGLDAVPMSTPDTGARTAAALRLAGARLRTTTPLCDVDTATDATLVAAEAPHTRFAQAWRTGAGQ